MRVVIDTNVWVSRLLLAGSVPAQAVDKALVEHEVVVSVEMIDELADVLSRGKFDRYVSVHDREEFVRRVLQVTTVVTVLSEVEDCRDPKDNYLLALALDSESGCVISGDNDLVELGPWRGIPIVTPSAFITQ